MLKKLTGESDEELLSLLLDDAEAYILAYTGRTRLPEPLNRTRRELAVIALNRMGTEGESARSEGGESYNFDTAPKSVYATLNRYRLARVGGHLHEAKAKQDQTILSQDCNPPKG